MNKIILIVFSISIIFAEFGEVVHSIPAPGHYSNGLAWDGSSLWVANIADASHSDDYWYRIFQISPEDGEILTSFSTNPYFYHGLTFDENYLWGEHNYTSIEKLDNLGESLQEFSAVPLAVGLAFDQYNNILFQSTTQPGAIYKFDADTGEIIGELYPDEPYEHGWGDLAFDGTYLWHINVASDMIYKIDQYTGAILDQFPAPSNQCEGLTFDGWYLWVSDTSLDILYQIEIEFNFILGDINEDGILNILDIVLMVNMILSNEYSVVADVNEDGFINILDIVLMVNILVGGLPQSN